MCPRGAVHVPFRGAVKVCKRLQIDYAEAVVDFEFGHRMAVPVIQGVVIAQEYHDEVMEQLRIQEEERSRKEDDKRRKAALGKWRKFIMGMRIVQRIRLEYGEINNDVSVFGHSQSNALAGAPANAHDEDLAGGFLPEGYEEDDGTTHAEAAQSSFFPAAHDEDGDDDDLVMEDDRPDQNRRHAAEPVADEEDDQEEQAAAPPKRKATRASSRKTRNRKTVVSEDEEEEVEQWQPDDDE